MSDSTTARPASSSGNPSRAAPTKSTPTKKVLNNGTSASPSAKSSSRLTPSMRSDINAALLAGGQVDRIQSHLLTHLSQTSWPTSIRHLCLSLLRSGEATTYAQLLRRVREEVRKGGEGEWDVGVPTPVVQEGIGVVRDCLGEVVELE